MTNVPFASIDQFRDLDSINAYRELVEEQHVFTAEEMMRYLCRKSRDNARTPFQWDDSAYAGFSTVEPWIMVNPNYKEINAKKQVDDPESVFNYYRKLIALRKEKEIIVYGTYDLLLPESKKFICIQEHWERKNCWWYVTSVKRSSSRDSGGIPQGKLSDRKLSGRRNQRTDDDSPV